MYKVKIQIFVVIICSIIFPAAAQERSDTLGRSVQLGEVLVRPGKEKYSKKNNPAVDFVTLIRNRSDVADPYEMPNYNYEKYEKITIAINNVTDSVGNLQGVFRNLQFLKNHLDTADVTGNTILPVSIKEKISDVYYRKSPETHREYVKGINRRGIDEFTNQESVQAFLDEIFREIDLYENDITILTNRFVSPLSKIGPDFYKYYLTDTVSVDGDDCVELMFAPHNNTMFGFAGKIYVLQNDSAMFIKRAELILPKNSNVNFVESLKIDQTFARDSLGRRHKTEDVLTVEFSIVSGLQGFYAQRKTDYREHNYNVPERDYLLDRSAPVVVSADAYLKPAEFWESRRGVTTTQTTEEIGTMIASLRDIPLYYWSERVLKVLVSGYIHTGEKGKLDIGPVNTMLSFNDVEGTRFRLGGLTTAYLNRHWFGRGYVAYGTKDHRFKYSAEIEYSFNEKKKHSREFPMHALRLTHSYDVDAIGQNYAFTNSDNFFLSWKRMKDTLMVYNRKTRVEYLLELDNNFSLNLSLIQDRMEPSRYLQFNMWNGTNLSHINSNVAQIQLRYAPGEKFYQTNTHRIPVNLDAPVFVLTHTYGPHGFCGNNYTVNRTEFSAMKRFWFSAFGYMDVILKGGHVWSTSAYPELLTASANLSYTIQPESFALISPLEFISDSFASVDLTYWGNGVLFNSIPLFNRLRLREVVAFRGYLGRLSDKNNPEINHWLPLFPQGANPVAMHGKPYMEMSAGIDNIFKCLRVDYVWRLSYCNTPGADKSGLRLAMHFNF